MGDSGEGLVDAEGRIQERMEEMQRERELKKGRVVRDPKLQREIDSLQLARTQLASQLEAATHAGRKAQLSHALAAIDGKLAAMNARLSSH